MHNWWNLHFVHFSVAHFLSHTHVCLSFYHVHLHGHNCTAHVFMYVTHFFMFADDCRCITQDSKRVYVCVLTSTPLSDRMTQKQAHTMSVVCEVHKMCVKIDALSSASTGTHKVALTLPHRRTSKHHLLCKCTYSTSLFPFGTPNCLCSMSKYPSSTP